MRLTVLIGIASLTIVNLCFAQENDEFAFIKPESEKEDKFSLKLNFGFSTSRIWGNDTKELNEFIDDLQNNSNLDVSRLGYSSFAQFSIKANYQPVKWLSFESGIENLRLGFRLIFKETANSNNFYSLKQHYRTDYLGIPILLNFHVIERLKIQLGFTTMFNLNKKFINTEDFQLNGINQPPLNTIPIVFNYEEASSKPVLFPVNLGLEYGKAKFYGFGRIGVTPSFLKDFYDFKYVYLSFGLGTKLL